MKICADVKYTIVFLFLLCTAISKGESVTPTLRDSLFNATEVRNGLSAALHKMSTTTANIMFLLYAVLNGVTLSSIFFIYQLGSIAFTFFITAGVFLAMSIYGYVTKKNLNTFGSYCVMGLFGIIIATVVNLFVHSSTLEWIVSFIGVGIFMGLTAWDTQKIKESAYVIEPSMVGKLAVIGALSLYLDFINMFLYLLRFFGNGRD